jgi:hypothetical protein
MILVVRGSSNDLGSSASQVIVAAELWIERALVEEMTTELRLVVGEENGGHGVIATYGMVQA